MKRTRRLNQPTSLNPSIDPMTHGGEGNIQRADGNQGLRVGRRPIQRVLRDHTRTGTLTEVRTDLVSMGRRSVLARSGNDHRLHDPSDSPDGGMWQGVAGPEHEVTPVTKSPWAGVAALAAFGALVYIVKAR